MGIFAPLDVVSGVVSLANKAMAYFTKRSDQMTGATIQAEKDKAAVAESALIRVNADIAVQQTSTDDLRKEVLTEGPKP